MPTEFELVCLQCDQSMRAKLDWCGDPVMCPHCRTPLRVPANVDAHTEALRAEPAGYTSRSVFNFPCPRCEGLLQAHTGMVNQRGTCPTCTARFTIPELRRGRPGRAELLEEESPEMSAPLHAFAGSGSTAPKIVTRDDGQTMIQCPKCEAHNPIDAEVCERCQTAFTLEAAPSTALSRSGGRATMSLILGLLGVVTFPTFLPSIGAVWLGFQAVFEPSQTRAPAPALFGIVLGTLGLLLGGIWLFWMLK